MGLCLKRDCASLGSLTVPVKPVVLRENSLLCGGYLAIAMKNATHPLRVMDGTLSPSYQSRWWPAQELSYTSRQIPNFVLRYESLVSDNKWGRVTLWLDDPALG
jgi:hypothetical protein